MTAEQPDPDERDFLISRYLDGDVTEAERRAAERALGDDPASAATLEAYRRTDAWARSLRDSGPELDWDRFTREVRRRCEAQDPRARRRALYRLYAPLTAAAVIAVMCTAYFMSPNESAGPSAALSMATVQITRPAALTTARAPQRLVAVHPVRTPPPGLVGPPLPGKSYVIAVAGAKSFSPSRPAPATGPYF